MKSLDLCCFNGGRKSNYPEKLLIAYRLAFCFASVLPVHVLGKTKDCHHYSLRCLFPLNLQGILPSLQSHHPAKPLWEDVAFNGSKQAAVAFWCLPRAVWCGSPWHYEGSFQSFFPQPQRKERNPAGWPSLPSFLVKQSWGKVIRIQEGKRRLPTPFVSCPPNNIFQHPREKPGWPKKKPSATKWASH